MTNCCPCNFCRCYTSFYDNSTGYTDEGCTAGEDFEYLDTHTPCKSFKPYLVTDDLYEQLLYEDTEQAIK